VCSTEYVWALTTVAKTNTLIAVIAAAATDAGSREDLGTTSILHPTPPAPRETLRGCPMTQLTHDVHNVTEPHVEFIMACGRAA
jgi:hypothetical protein